jgi:hypothetical protein
LLDIDPVGELHAEAVALWKKMTNSIGQTRALEIWRSVGKGRPGRTKDKSSKPERLRVLLECFDIISEYDAFSGKPDKTIAGFISRETHRRRPGVYGASEDAITKAIVRALKKRDQQREEIKKLSSPFMSGDTVPKDIAAGFGLLGPAPKRPHKQNRETTPLRANRKDKKGTGI